MTIPFWISWYAEPEFGEFELHSPWWKTGYRDGAATVCAAVQATDPDDAMDLIYTTYDRRPEQIEFRFITEQAPGWSPYCDRFPAAPWMIWPEGTP